MNISELVTDTATKLQIEAKARKDAATGHYEEPYSVVDGSYQRQLLLSAANCVYTIAYYKRQARLKRMARE